MWKVGLKILIVQSWKERRRRIAYILAGIVEDDESIGLGYFSRAVLVIKTQQCCTIFCVVHCRVRRKSIFDPRRATPVEMCQEILLDSTVSPHSFERWEDCVTLVGALAP